MTITSKFARLPRSLSLLLPSSLMLLCSGCSAMANDRLTWLWLAVPLLGFGLAGLVIIFYRRRSQIASWDLRSSPEEPSPRRIILRIISIAGVIAIVFAIYNLLLQMDYGQKGLNIGLWFLGTIIGTALAIFLGLRLAEPPSLPEPKSLPTKPGRN
jgi:amino acid transporter